MSEGERVALKNKIDWLAFCEKEGSSRLDMSTPFVLNGWRYATDARVAIRIPCGEPNTEAKEKRFPPIEQLFANFPEDGFEPWPEVDVFNAMGDCPECDCGLVNSVECRKCLGRGFTVCNECGTEDDCKPCKGEGYVGDDCGNCNGKGELVWTWVQRIGDDYTAHAKYAELFRELPNVEFVNNNGKLLIRFDGGQGILMCLEKGSIKEVKQESTTPNTSP